MKVINMDELKKNVETVINNIIHYKEKKYIAVRKDRKKTKTKI